MITSHTRRARRGGRTGPLVTALATSACLALGLQATSAQAATTTFTVDSALNTNQAAATLDANLADNECKTAAGTCTLRAALDQANAMPASPGDDILINFSQALLDDEATIKLPGNGLRMEADGASHNGTSNAYLGNGFFYAVDAERPVRIDLGDGGDRKISIESENDANYGIFLVKSQNVTIENFKNLRAGAGSITVDHAATDTTIQNGGCLDPNSPILEVCVGLLSNTSDVTITDVDVDSPYYFSVFVDRLRTGDNPVSNVTITNLNSKDVEGYGDIWFELDAKVQNFTIDGAELNSPRGYGVGVQSGSEITGLTIKDSKFLGKNANAIWIYSNAETTNFHILDSEFKSNRWSFADNGGNVHTGLRMERNLFEDTLYQTINLDQGDYTDLLIDDNDFVDARGNGQATIEIRPKGTNNVISNNRFTQSADADHNRWAIYNGANVPATDDTGWAFIRNHVDGYVSNVGGPITNFGNGKSRMEGNTFGTSSRGTIIATESESAGGNWFVTNRGGAANNRIQTWRPTEATLDGTNVTLKVAPPTDAVAGNSPAPSNVVVDVFWTADDTAEEYVGRIGSIADPANPDYAVVGTDYSLPLTKTNGRIRVQTIDEDGNYSQYSSPILPAGAPPIAPAPPRLLDYVNADLVGTGQPGATVTVTDSDGNVVGTSPVDADGNWSVDVSGVGCTKLKATQEDADGEASDVSDELSTPACVGTPAISEIDDTGAVVGTGDAGAEVTVRDDSGTVVGTTTVDADGNWKLEGPLPCGVTLSATQTKDGHTSTASNTVDTPDCIDAPRIKEVAGSGDLEGDSALPNATVRVYDENGKLVGETTADADGNWTLDGPLPCGTTLVARQTLGDGNVSPDSNTLETAACPPAPVIAAIDDDGNVDGTGQAGATVTVRDQDGRVVGTAKVRPNGTWDISGPVPCGATLTATQTDNDGHVSSVSDPMKTDDCPSTPAPAAPTLDAVGDDGKARGTGQPGATIQVYDQDGSLVGQALVRSDGGWTVAGPVACGTTLTARQIATDGQVSALSGELKVPACKAPTPPPTVTVTTPAPAPAPTITTPAPPVDTVRAPKSEDDIRLQCGEIPLALVDVRRGAKSKSTKRYSKTRIVGVADTKHVGERVAIRYLGTSKVVARPKVRSNGRFVANVADRDQRDRTNANRRRFRAEIGGERSGDMKLTRRYRITSVRASGDRWTVRSSVSRPFIAGARVRIMVMDDCGDKGWRQVGNARIDSKGRANVRVDAPRSGGYQLVRLATEVRQEGKRGKRGARIGTYTVPRGLR